MVEKEDCGECGAPVLQVPSTRLALKKTYEKQCCLCDSVKKFHSFCVRQVVPRYHALDYPIDKWCKEVDDSFYCFNCRTKCFMCSQTHNYTDSKSRRVKCSGCGKKWCYVLESCGPTDDNLLCYVCSKKNKDLNVLNYSGYESHCHVCFKGESRNWFWTAPGTKLPDDVCHVSQILLKNHLKTQKFLPYVRSEKDLGATVHPVSKSKRVPPDACHCVPGVESELDTLNQTGELSQVPIKREDVPILAKNNCTVPQCINYFCCVECPSTCQLGMQCHNQRISKNVWKTLLLFNEDGRGIGVKSLCAIQKDDFIVEYTGLAVKESFIAKQENYDKRYLMDWYGPGTRLDARKFGSVARYINHSCKPNAYVRKWSVDGETRVGVFALKTIKEYEELSYDYGWTTQNNKVMAVCRCGYKECSGFIHKLLENSRFQQKCNFVSLKKINNQEVWYIDPKKIFPHPKKEVMDYLRITNNVNGQPGFDYANCVEQWKADAKTSYDFILKRAQCDEFLDTKELLEFLCGYLSENIKKCKNQGFTDFYQFFFDTYCIEMTDICTKEIDRQGEYFTMKVNPRSTLWIAARECFGSKDPDGDNRVIAVEDYIPTKLGKKLQFQFGTGGVIKPYKNVDEIFSNKHPPPTPVVIVSKFFSENSQNKKKSQKKLLNAFQHCKYDPIVQRLQNIVKDYLSEKDKYRHHQPLLKLAYKLAMTDPGHLLHSSNDEDLSCIALPYCQINFFWACCNKTIGSIWKTLVDDNDDTSVNLQLPTQAASSQESNQTNVDQTTNATTDDVSISSDMSNFPYYIKNDNPDAIQFDISSLVDCNLIMVDVKRHKVSDDIGRRVSHPKNIGMSRIFSHKNIFNYNKIYERMNHYFGLSEMQQLNADFTSRQQCYDVIKQRFTSLNPYRMNIFLINQMAETPMGCLYVPVASLQQLIDECFHPEISNCNMNGDIDDAIINFMVEFLNFYHNYDVTKDSQQEKAPSKFFMGTYDDIHCFNPCFNVDDYPLLSNDAIGTEQYGENEEIDTSPDLIKWFHRRNDSELYRLLYFCQKNSWGIPNIYGCFRRGERQYDCVIGKKINKTIDLKTYSNTKHFNKSSTRACFDDAQCNGGRMWLAKYLSLHQQGLVNEQEWNCVKMKRSGDPFGNYVTHSGHEMPPEINECDSTSDGYHSTGIICLMMWLNDIRDNGALPMDRKNLILLRLSIFSFIIKIHDDLCDKVNKHPFILEKPDKIKYSRVNQIANLYLKSLEYKIDREVRIKFKTISEILDYDEDKYQDLIFANESTLEKMKKSLKRKENNVTTRNKKRKITDSRNDLQSQDASNDTVNDKSTTSQNQIVTADETANDDTETDATPQYPDADNNSEYGEEDDGTNEKRNTVNSNNEREDTLTNNSKEEEIDGAIEKNMPDNNQEKEIDSDSDSQDHLKLRELRGMINKEYILSKQAKKGIHAIEHRKIRMSPDHGETLSIIPLLQEFFCSRWDYDNDKSDKERMITTQKKNDELYENIDRMLNKYNTYFLIDKVLERQYQDQFNECPGKGYGNIIGNNNETVTESYQIVCAAISEDNVILGDKAGNAKAAIIHYMATHTFCQGKGYATELLKRMCQHSNYDTRSIIFATANLTKYSEVVAEDTDTYDLNDRRYQHLSVSNNYSHSEEHVFHKNLGFKFHKFVRGQYYARSKKNPSKRITKEWTEIPSDDVADLVFKHSVMCWIKKIDLRSTMRSRAIKNGKKKGFNKNIKGRTCICFNIEKTNNNWVTAVTDEKNEFSHFESKSFHYDEGSVLTENDIKNIPKRKIKSIKTEPGKYFKIVVGGSRDRSSIHGNYYDVIPSHFRQSNYPDTKNCVWLAVCIAVYFADTDEGLHLLSYMRLNPDKFHNIPFWKQAGVPICDDDNMSLRAQLARTNLQWHITKIKDIRRKDYNDYIMTECKSGIYICLLCPMDNVIEHTVAIDCCKGLIYDCEEEGSLRLTQSNLDRCCGEGKTFKCFQLIYELIKK